MSDARAEVAELVDRYLSDEMQPEQLERLERLLLDHPELRSELIEQGSLHTDLHYAMRAERATAGLLRGIAEDDARELDRATPKGSPRRITPARSLAIAASIVLAAGLTALMTGDQADVNVAQQQAAEEADQTGEADSKPNEEAAATLYYTTGAAWATDAKVDPSEKFRNGRTLHVGQRLKLAAGLAELAYVSGVKVVLQGPAEFELQSTKELLLHSGRLTARVPIDAIGFTVNTASSSVVDLGTEFGVSASEDGKSDVVVFTGKVLVASSANDDSRQLVSAGGAVRADLSGEVTDVRGGLEAGAWVRTIRRPKRSGLGDVVAGFNRDFEASALNKPTAVPGWSYYWNPTAPIGVVDEYRPLRWDGQRYVPFGDSAFPAPPPARSLLLGWFGGHPGPDLAMCVDRIERAPIAGYAAPEAGRYAIAGSWLTRMTAARRDGGDNGLRLVIHDDAGEELYDESVHGDQSITFDIPLGPMKRGEQVYLAVLPQQSSRYDTFHWDFSIVRVGESAKSGDQPRR